MFQVNEAEDQETPEADLPNEMDRGHFINDALLKACSIPSRVVRGSITELVQQEGKAAGKGPGKVRRTRHRNVSSRADLHHIEDHLKEMCVSVS